MNARLKGPENHGGFSHGGVSYEPDADGFIEVPHEALAAAFSHGFSLAAEQPGSPGGTGDDDKPVDLAKFNKKDLLAYAKEKFGLELDATKTNKVLIEEIEAAQAAKDAAEAGDQ